MKPKRFHVYVANRIQQICDLTDPKSWFYIDTSSNPLDDASQGLTTKHNVSQVQNFCGRKDPVNLKL